MVVKEIILETNPFELHGLEKKMEALGVLYG